MRKFVISLLVCIICAIGCAFYYYSPINLAQPKYVSTFFNLPSETNSSFIVLDKMYSQGKNGCIGMGSDNYWLKIVGNPQSLGRMILNAGGSQTDSIYSITVIRGDIEGTFIIRKYDDKGHLRFHNLSN